MFDKGLLSDAQVGKLGIYERDGVTYFLAIPYYKEFRDAYFAYKKELQTNSTLQQSFDKGEGDQTIPTPAKKILDSSNVVYTPWVSGAVSSVSTASVVIFAPTMRPLKSSDTVEQDSK